MSSISPNISASDKKTKEEEQRQSDSTHATIDNISQSSSISSPPHNFNFYEPHTSSAVSNDQSSSWLLRLNPKYLVWRYFVKLFKAEQFLRKMYNTDDFGVIYNNVSKRYEQYKKNHQLPKESLFFTNSYK